MAKFTKKISSLVSRQFPQHIQANNPLLVEFVKQYYRFLDSAQITLSSVSARVVTLRLPLVQVFDVVKIVHARLLPVS